MVFETLIWKGEEKKGEIASSQQDWKIGSKKVRIKDIKELKHEIWPSFKLDVAT